MGMGQFAKDHASWIRDFGFRLADNDLIYFGDDADATMGWTGAALVFTGAFTVSGLTTFSNAGDFTHTDASAWTFDNQVDGPTYFDLGSDANTAGFIVRNNSGTVILRVDADLDTTINVRDNAENTFLVQQGANRYIGCDTRDGQEKVDIGENLQLAAGKRDISHWLTWGKRDDLHSPPVQATQTVTFIATDPTAADTITVDGIVYTIAAVPADFAYEVDLNTTETTMAANFAAAINNTGTIGTTYSNGIAAHPTVKASVNGAVVTLTAREPGRHGNDITLAVSSTGATGGGTTLTGGRDGETTGFSRLAGTDAQCVAPTHDTTQPGGVWQLTCGNNSGTPADDMSLMVWDDRPVQINGAGGVVVFECRLRIKTGITGCSVFAGLTDTPTIEEPITNAADVFTEVADDCVGFHYDDDATTKEWFGVAIDSTAQDTGISASGTAPVADTYQILRCEVSSDGATINFYIDDTLVDTLSGAQGVSPDVVLYPMIGINGSGTPTSRVLDVDWIEVGGVRL